LIISSVIDKLRQYNQKLNVDVFVDNNTLTVFCLTSKSIFDLEVNAIVNPVNTVGVSGKGLALEFKKRYNLAYEAYVNKCNDGLFNIGSVFTYSEDQYIIFFPTKRHWKHDSKYAYIEEGMVALRQEIIDKDIKSIAIPALGCGLGGLVFDDVKDIIYQHLKGLDLFVYLIKPGIT
jgi:O-acetyl-ADP-ribose deacetylase (regulator of RNase III)